MDDGCAGCLISSVAILAIVGFVSIVVWAFNHVHVTF